MTAITQAPPTCRFAKTTWISMVNAMTADRLISPPTLWMGMPDVA